MVGFQVPVLSVSTCRDHQAHQALRDPRVTKVSGGSAKRVVKPESLAGPQSPGRGIEYLPVLKAWGKKEAKGRRGRREKGMRLWGCRPCPEGAGGGTTETR